MGQAKQDCPKCGRPPGGRHPDNCPRSKLSQAHVEASTGAAGRSRPFYPGKGGVVTSFTDVIGERHTLVNKGMPHVNPAKGKPPTAGGLPKGVTLATMVEEVEFFRKGVEAMRARLAAAESADQAWSTEGSEEDPIARLASETGASAPTIRAGIQAARERGKPVITTLAGDENRSLRITPEGMVSVIEQGEVEDA